MAPSPHLLHPTPRPNREHQLIKQREAEAWPPPPARQTALQVRPRGNRPQARRRPVAPRGGSPTPAATCSPTAAGWSPATLSRAVAAPQPPPSNLGRPRSIHPFFPGGGEGHGLHNPGHRCIAAAPGQTCPSGATRPGLQESPRRMRDGEGTGQRWAMGAGSRRT